MIGTRFLAHADIERPLVGQITAVPDAALVATARVLRDIRLNAVVLDLHGFHITPEQLQPGGELQAQLQECFDRHLSADERYKLLKRQESDLLAFYFDLQAEKLETEQVALLQRQIFEARALVYSSKTLNGIRENLVAMRHSSQEPVHALYRKHRAHIRGLYRQYFIMADQAERSVADREVLTELANRNQAHYLEANQLVHAMAAEDVVSGSELSTMLNVNREIHHAIKNLLLSLELPL